MLKVMFVLLLLIFSANANLTTIKAYNVSSEEQEQDYKNTTVLMGEDIRFVVMFGWLSIATDAIEHNKKCKVTIFLKDKIIAWYTIAKNKRLKNKSYGEIYLLKLEKIKKEFGFYNLKKDEIFVFLSEKVDYVIISYN